MFIINSLETSWDFVTNSNILNYALCYINKPSLKRQMFTPSGCKVIVIRIFDFVAKNQFLSKTSPICREPLKIKKKIKQYHKFSLKSKSKSIHSPLPLLLRMSPFYTFFLGFGHSFDQISEHYFGILQHSDTDNSKFF